MFSNGKVVAKITLFHQGASKSNTEAAQNVTFGLSHSNLRSPSWSQQLL
jgi:hypothetical protein